MLPDESAPNWDWVRRYCAMGLSVIPLKPHSKQPYIPDWVHECTTNENTAWRWWKQMPDANIGVVLGDASHAFVLDYDKRRGGLATAEHLQYQHGIPDTLTSHTGGGGLQQFYQTPHSSLRTNPNFLDGCELRAEGAQVVVPPSIHPDTLQRYWWDLPDDDLCREMIKPAPAWLLRMLEEPAKPVLKPPEPVQERVPKGQRQSAMVSMAGILRERCGATKEELYAYLQVFNRTRCDPPKDEKFVRQIAESVAGYDVRDPRLVGRMARAYSIAKAQSKVEAELIDDEQETSVSDLLDGNIQPLQQIVEEMFCEGLSILYAPPKTGKSVLATQIALAVTTGTPLFASQKILKPGPVLYMSLEEKEPESAAHIQQLWKQPGPRPKIHFYYRMPTLFDGGVERLQLLIARHNPVVVIIDSFRAIASRIRDADIVKQEYMHTVELANMAKEHRAAFILIHHAAKYSQNKSFMDGAAGTHGLTAGADNILGLTQDGDFYSFVGNGRGVDFHFLMEKRIRDKSGWHIVARGEDARWTQERDDIFRLLKEEGGPEGMTPKQIATGLGSRAGTVRRLLRKMVASRQLYQDAYGRYRAIGESLLG